MRLRRQRRVVLGTAQACAARRPDLNSPLPKSLEALGARFILTENLQAL